MVTSSCYFGKFSSSFGHFGKGGKEARALIEEKTFHIVSPSWEGLSI